MSLRDLAYQFLTLCLAVLVDFLFDLRSKRREKTRSKRVRQVLEAELGKEGTLIADRIEGWDDLPNTERKKRYRRMATVPTNPPPTEGEEP